ncbi:hypothetical protein B0G83_105365 [Paraburkholderia sp. BL21I4N1]|nr:hypothetical protein B0G83_105365 [Paraburkholderia sp. BL21I4N1]
MDTNTFTLESDRALIKSLGGPARVAKLLGFKRGGTQRVHNWTVRGIPASVRLRRPDILSAKAGVAFPEAV